MRQVLWDLMAEGLFSDYEDNEDDDFNDKMSLLMMTYNVPDIGKAFFFSLVRLFVEKTLSVRGTGIMFTKKSIK